MKAKKRSFPILIDFSNSKYRSSDLQNQDKDLEALTCYEKALNFYPQDSELLNELGSFFAK